MTDTGVSDVTVTAYDKQGVLVGSATTDANGDYIINPTGAGPYRVEFTTLPDGYAPTTHSSANGTTTQFVTTAGSAANVNLAVNDPCDYCQNSPKLAASFARPTTNFYTGFDSPQGIYTYDLTSLGTTKAIDGNPGVANMPKTTVADGSTVGNVNGLAWRRSTKTLFSAAYARSNDGTMGSNDGVGPGGLGAIYQTTNGTTSVLVTVANVGTFTGATAEVAKVGLGGIALSKDETTLYAVNIYSKTLAIIPVAGNPPVAGMVTQIALPQPANCNADDTHPFAVERNGAKVYIGLVCGGPATTDLRAYVYEYDGTNFTQKLDFSMNYSRTNASDDNNVSRTPDINHSVIVWEDNPPVSSYTDHANSANMASRARFAPMLTDIVFHNGDMVLGFRSRLSDQIVDSEWTISGEILRACADSAISPTTWSIESNGDCNGKTTINPPPVTDPWTGANNGRSTSKGPGGYEYYWGDNGYESEMVQGGLAQIPGSDRVYVTQIDALGHRSQHGIAALSHSSGKTVVAGNIAQVRYSQSGSSRAMKENVMGDLEFLCDPAPTELGNRVWDDLNGNGVQDPGEPGINGVQVSLQGPTNTVTTNTSDDGNYYFNVAANTAYTITINTTPSGYELTTGNAEALSGASVTSNDPISDTRDSDATLVGGIATIYYTTGSAGENNHGLDFGFTKPTAGQVDILNIAPAVAWGSLGNRVWYDTNNNGTVDGSEQNVADGVVVELYQDSDSSGAFSAGDSRVADTVTSGGYYTFTDLVPTSSNSTTYLVVISDTNFLSGGLLYGYVDSSGQYTDTLNAAGDNRDHGVAVNRLGQAGGVVASGVITLTAGTQPTSEGNEGNDPIQASADANSNQTIDFGFYKLTLGDRIWEDLNNDGIDDSEPALSTTLVVTATNQSTGDVYTTTTDANGYYTFTGILSGTYVVSFVAPAGYSSSGTDGTPNGADLDDDGGGSSGGLISSAPVALTPGVTIQDVQMVANATGSTANPSVDFGLWLPAALGNYVWLDTTTDGIQNEAAINGVNGVTVTLFYSNPVTGLWEQSVVTTTANHPTTNNPGYYTFTQLISGTYYVSFTLPAGYSFTTPDAAGSSEATDSDADLLTGATAPITLNAGEQNPDVDAGLLAPTLSLGNRVWYDVNNNGAIDGSESGLAGVRVELYRDSDGSGDFTPGVDAYVTYSDTISGGYYTFTNLSEGGYLVVISSTNFSGVLLGYRSSDPTSADPNDNVDSDDNGLWQASGLVASGVITLTLGNEPDGSPEVDGDNDANTNWTVDFGFYLADLGDAPDSYSTTLSNTTPYTGASHVVSNTLYLGSRVDADADGQPVASGAAALNDDDTVAAAAVGGAGDDEDGIVFVNDLVAGQLVTVEVTVTGDGGYLNGWLDFGADGAWTQAGDQIFDGVAVNSGMNTLTFTVPLTASTNITTYARFRLSTDANLNFYDSSVPAPDGEVEDYNVLIQPPAGIGDRVWYDDNYNGIQDGGETGVMSVTVELLSSSDDVISTTQTNATGYYSFTNLAPGLYGIRFVTSTLPAGYIITLRDVSSDNAADSDANPATGRTLDTLLTNGEYDPDWDLGIFLPQPTIAVIKYTNGDDADTAPGVTIDVGEMVTWTYAISNTGNVTLTNVTLSDDIEGSVTCPQTALPPHTGMTCVLTGTAIVGPYANIAIVTGTPTLGPVTVVTDTNPSHYTNAPTVLIGDRLWVEDDNDGDATTGTVTPVGAGHIVTATDGTTVYTDTTDANGYYTITVPANATYTVTTDLPPGGVIDTPVLATDGSNPVADNTRHHDRTGTTVVVTLTDNLSIDFGFFQPTPTIEEVKYTNGDDADTPLWPDCGVGQRHDLDLCAYQHRQRHADQCHLNG
ncbi:MAG: SdrD B-like domain-containing protein [Caldilineaceae bacterium]